MSITLISATPSPYARMNRIAMIEKGIPFELKSEIPWHNTTQTPQYNPLEKLPIMLFDDGRDPVYDSAQIQEYIVQKFADKSPRLITGNIDADLKARQIQTLAEGVMDAFVLAFFEDSRPKEKQSAEWLARQNRKVDGGMKAFEDLVASRPDGQDFLIGNQLTIADIALACAVEQVNFGGTRSGWQEKYPKLAKYMQQLDGRSSFRDTKPVMFDINREGVVA